MLKASSLERSSLAYFLTPIVLYLFTLALAEYLPAWVKWLLKGLALLGCCVVLHLLDEGRFPCGSILGGWLLLAFVLAKCFEPAPLSRIDLAWLCVIAPLAVVGMVACPVWFAWALGRQRARFGPLADLITACLLGAALAQLAALLWAGDYAWNHFVNPPDDLPGVKEMPVIDRALEKIAPTLWRVAAGLQGVVCAVIALWSGFLLWRIERAAPIIASRPHELARNAP